MTNKNRFSPRMGKRKTLIQTENGYDSYVYERNIDELIVNAPKPFTIVINDNTHPAYIEPVKQNCIEYKICINGKKVLSEDDKISIIENDKNKYDVILVQTYYVNDSTILSVVKE